MTYSEIVDWLFKQVPNYQHQGGVAYKPGLERIHALLKERGDPHTKIPVIHVAGTNGKGSVSHILAAVFQEHGYKVGLFTSPHIVDFRERIKINGIWVEEDFVVRFFEKNKALFESIQPSFFEITTAMAFEAFTAHECDIAIIETGLGGRLDSTNVVRPEISVITNIGLDHTAFLGDTLPQIAVEKAGIIKSNTPVVIGDAEKGLRSIFAQIAAERSAPIVFSEDVDHVDYETDLLGQFQQRNIHTVVQALKVLQKKWALTFPKIEQALQNVIKLTNFTGRLQLISDSPRIIVDAAHNLEGIQNLLAEIDALQNNGFKYRQLRIVYGASNDKNWRGVVSSFPSHPVYYFVEFNSSRSVKRQEFYTEAKKTTLNFNSYDSVEEGLNQCKTDANENDLILVCGSFYILEKIN